MHRMKVGGGQEPGLQFLFVVNMKYAGCCFFKTSKDMTYITYILMKE